MYDMLGKSIATLVDAQQEAGTYSVVLDAGTSRLNLASGDLRETRIYHLCRGPLFNIDTVTNRPSGAPCRTKIDALVSGRQMTLHDN